MTIALTQKMATSRVVATHLSEIGYVDEVCSSALRTAIARANVIAWVELQPSPIWFKSGIVYVV